MPKAGYGQRPAGPGVRYELGEKIRSRPNLQGGFCMLESAAVAKALRYWWSSSSPRGADTTRIVVEIGEAELGEPVPAGDGAVVAMAYRRGDGRLVSRSPCPVSNASDEPFDAASAEPDRRTRTPQVEACVDTMQSPVVARMWAKTATSRA